LQFQFLLLAIDMCFGATTVDIAVQFSQNLLLDGPMKTVKDDGDHSEFGVGFDKSGVCGD